MGVKRPLNYRILDRNWKYEFLMTRYGSNNEATTQKMTVLELKKIHAFNTFSLNSRSNIKIWAFGHHITQKPAWPNDRKSNNEQYKEVQFSACSYIDESTNTETTEVSIV